MGALLGHQNGVLKLKFALDLEEWVELPGKVAQRPLDKPHEGVEESMF